MLISMMMWLMITMVMNSMITNLQNRCLQSKGSTDGRGVNELESSRGSPRYKTSNLFSHLCQTKPFAHVWESHCLTVKRKSLTPFLSFRHQKHYRQTSLLIKVKHWQYRMNNDVAIQNAISTFDHGLFAGLSAQVQARPRIKHVSFKISKSDLILNVVLYCNSFTLFITLSPSLCSSSSWSSSSSLSLSCWSSSPSSCWAGGWLRQMCKRKSS